MKNQLKNIRLAALILALLPIFCAAAADVQPTADQQVLLERINAARVSQAEESARLNLDFQAGMSYKVQPNLQPLVWRGSLEQAAEQHNEDMWDRNYYDHETPEGLTPCQQALKFDPDFIAAGQNLGAGRIYASADSIYSAWMIDAGITDAGHRQVILNTRIDCFGGAASSRANTFYGVYWTAYFGVSKSQQHFVTGVIYRDLNRNGRYDAGEGLPHWKVRLVAQSPETSNATSTPISNTATATEAAVEPAYVNAYDTGGYAVAAPAEGDYTVEAVSPDGQTVYSSTGIGDANVKVDFVIAASQPAAEGNTVVAPSSGKKAGCDLGSGSTGATWAFLAAMGALLIGILALRIRTV